MILSEVVLHLSMYRRNRTRRAFALRPVDSTKNIVQFEGSIATATVLVTNLTLGVNPTGIDEADAAKTYYVEDGASLKAITMGLRITDSVGGTNKCVICLRRNPNGQYGAPTVAQMNSLGSQPWKNDIFQCLQAKPSSQSGPGMMFFGITIPKRFHKVHRNDIWELIISNSGANTMDVCGIAIYKWYR